MIPLTEMTHLIDFKKENNTTIEANSIKCKIKVKRILKLHHFYTDHSQNYFLIIITFWFDQSL